MDFVQRDGTVLKETPGLCATSISINEISNSLWFGFSVNCLAYQRSRILLVP